MAEAFRRRVKVGAVYGGALLGPLGGGVVAPMLPEIGRAVHVSAGAAASSLTAYFVPFALVQVVSGTVGERWGRRRTVRIAYLAYAVGAVVCAVAPSLPVFLAARAVLGTANAFTSPLLLAGLGDIVARDRLGRAVGVYSSCQAAGQSFAPLVGGIAAASSWRLGFVVVAAAAGLLAFAPPPGEPRPATAAPPWRPLVSRRMGLLSLASLMSYIGASALPFMVALYAREQLGVSPGLTGVALLGFGVAGLVLGAVWGRVAERFGARRCGGAAAVVTGVFVAVAGLSGTAGELALWWTLAGAGASMMIVALQSLTLRAVPRNRGGALSAVSAFRFGGGAVAPLVWLPIYHARPAAAFVAAACSLLVVVPALALLGDPPAE
ncbi:MFS transporter [Actinomadura darangshiensis]|uniref:MFS transporter n=1 Tax=Actinomadura darangshiensis TaxID=705336 RepID=A0A4R5C3L7_9ACTN|nr:MFS transporter [Actinomadura darangshiensis]TDD91382.1 MFS transporter [Actinomadura darangshiensis]